MKFKVCTLPALKSYPAKKEYIILCPLYATGIGERKKNKQNKKTQKTTLTLFHSNSQKLTMLHISFVFEDSSDPNRKTTWVWLTMHMA